MALAKYSLFGSNIMKQSTVHGGRGTVKGSRFPHNLLTTSEEKGSWKKLALPKITKLELWCASSVIHQAKSRVVLFILQQRKQDQKSVMDTDKVIFTNFVPVYCFHL